jgi:arylsulfatase A-like enzyme
MPANVLLLVFDTARADAFEPYGAGPTPAMAQLASAGQAVEDVFATASWTLPSHASMFTGELPRALGLTQAPGGLPHGARPVLEARAERMLPEVLRRAGWSTAAASANVWVTAESGFATGFERFETAISRRQVEMEHGNPRARLRWALETLRARVDDGAEEIGAMLRRWLREPPARPFFWFVNLIECHSPYLPPKPYDDLGPVARLKAADEARRHLTPDAIWRTCVGDFDVPDEALERMRHLYARSIRQLDDWLAGVLEALDAAGVLDDTLVLVTSDHGENFGEGGLLAHAFSLDDRLIRVPLVASRPDFVRRPGPHSLVQLPRLLAEYLGVAEHPWRDDPLPAGCAAAQFDMIAADDPRVDVAAEAWRLDERGRERLFTPLTCVTDGTRKLQARGDARELFDLPGDPLELRPLPAADSPAPLSSGLADPRLWARDRPPAPTVPQAELDELEGRMKLLGYM